MQRVVRKGDAEISETNAGILEGSLPVRKTSTSKPPAPGTRMIESDS
jgi:hypothetical protein